jgi:hypothetical protein
MKDDTATLTSIGVRTNSIITLNGEKVDVRYYRSIDKYRTKYYL